MPSNTPDQQIPRPTDSDAADNPVAFTNAVAAVEPRLVRTYTNEADRTARMLVLSENNMSGLATENRVDIYDGATHVSLHARALFAERLRTVDAAPVNNSTTLVPDTVLTVTMPTAGRFHFQGVIFYSSSVTADFKLGILAPTGAITRWSAVGAATTVSSGVGSGQWRAVSAPGPTVLTITLGGDGVGAGSMLSSVYQGSVVMGGTGGTFQVQYAQQTLDPTDTVVYSHSRLEMWRVS